MMDGVNRLGASTSPYLLQHAGNPVDWWEWGEDAFAEARRRNVPILLSVGYSSCTWARLWRVSRVPGWSAPSTRTVSASSCSYAAAGHVIGRDLLVAFLANFGVA